MRSLGWTLLLTVLISRVPDSHAEPLSPRSDLVLVQGAGGEDQYAAAFNEWAQVWKDLAATGDMQLHTIADGTGEPSDRALLEQTLAALGGDTQRPLWIVLIGHGTYFQGEAKFNLTGPDVSANDLSTWLETLERPIAVVNCASCSGPFLDRLSGPNRVVVTATRSGVEQNFARFGQFLSEAIQSAAADIDHDGEISLLEAFLTASRKTQAFYVGEGRLATEHALLDDNGDRTGTPSDFFRGIRAVAESEGELSVDGLRAHQWMIARISEHPALTPEQLQQRDTLETAIEELRGQKTAMPEDEYYDRLETYLLQIARLHSG